VYVLINFYRITHIYIIVINTLNVVRDVCERRENR